MKARLVVEAKKQTPNMMRHGEKILSNRGDRLKPTNADSLPTASKT
jgi:hypothetical protein